MKKRAVLLDKDGTLLDDVPYNVAPSLMRFAPGAAEALALFAAHGFRLIVISNQSGVALGRFRYEALGAVQARLREMFAACGTTLDAAYWCPHHPAGTVAQYAVSCTCRKPAPGLLVRAAREHALDLAQSWFVGDILDDVEAGTRAGCRTALVDNGNETEWRDGPLRRPTLRAPDLHRAALAIAAYECAESKNASPAAPASGERS
ncbi:HAD-IIIA family hydrolase [Trinickia caryophylli]|uniref:D,D-heptose 1,7-bisphosphate phosphatase n=1 Tax=Trinickia caryophylli TaxID=28094 RepID=A0A1X7EB83_TRICW|nr:HAD-IIIA family hydrolase [Trinickia caryophylli]PMS12950.1 HAD family hydrolase [Trinickia caryophylli]TRX14711.1 HAD-IIIA family hydrolase [Trinickia caryophylli]WQE14554.1 HAD-IIIA family hydrolase [Trinickia caryophylli]SMF30883.1 D,D-heptose 1,7-bisphosphate phosphatase [Trinickia caryophylli]GLU32036.1 D,D-heptose 1,7-bisphosphate phosphatase [Trinickia caryophylli]